MSESPMLGLRLKAHLNYELLAIALVVGLAAVTRLYQLGTFPYFPPQNPWLGDASGSACPAGMPGVWPGLYRDEMSRLCEVAFFPHALTTYEPSMQILFIKASQFLLGQNYFADRLPSALASILTAVVVYLAGKQLYKTKTTALIASLYFVAMTPALVYGRMIFYENLVGLFLAGTIYFISRFENEGRRRWLYLGALAAALAPFAKVDGLFVTVFFSLWAISNEGKRQKVIPVVLSWTPIAAGGAVILVLVGTFQGVLHQWYFGLVGRELSYQFLFIQSMLNGYVAFDAGYIKPDFWYLFGFLSLGVLLAVGSRAGRLLVLALFAFVATFFVSFGIGTYYPIMLFPLFALAAGGGVEYLPKVGTWGALALYGLFYGPLVVSYIGSTTLPFIGTDYALFALKDALFVLPMVVWLALETASRGVLKKRFPLALVVLVAFFALLILGSPELYSYYFLGRVM